ncbi:hypothetical protein TDB9533_03097 [Thalassocella blandensis]|nr:hypothetical protein TDB9533_03097 [Thalassocella blandensis]
MMHTVSIVIKLLVMGILLSSPTAVLAYPLDGADETGIKRLLGYAAAQESGRPPLLPLGALLKTDNIALHLEGVTADIHQANQSASLQAAIDSIFKTRDPSYSVMVIDYADEKNIVWAGRNIEKTQNVGSVGKVITMLGMFDALAKAFPKTEDRQRILRETQVQAGDWVIYDEHKVPKFNATSKSNQFSILNPNDVFSLSEWLDHMVSASANGAGSVVWREAMLMRHFGEQYPVSAEKAQAFFKETPRKQLAELALAVSFEPVLSAELNPKQFQQGSFWTSTGKRYIPGTESYASTKMLASYLLRMEQGRLVDPWSSLEIKRYLYMTKRRYRYVYAPELNKSAVFFKSGSLYQCQPEEGYRCAKYMGNKRNFMNSIAVVESLPGDAKPYRYLVALISNVLKVNSAWDHSRLAAAIHQAVLTREKVIVQDEGSAEQVKKSGESD